MLLFWAQFPQHGLILLHVGVKGLWGKSEADVQVERITKLNPLARDGMGLNPSKWSVTCGPENTFPASEKEGLGRCWRGAG